MGRSVLISVSSWLLLLVLLVISLTTVCEASLGIGGLFRRRTGKSSSSAWSAFAKRDSFVSALDCLCDCLFPSHGRSLKSIGQCCVFKGRKSDEPFTVLKTLSDGLCGSIAISSGDAHSSDAGQVPAANTSTATAEEN